MKRRRPPKRFGLVGIRDFDARHGYKRCTPGGVGVCFVGGRRFKADADFWRDKKGRLVVRFSSRGYVYQFAAFRTSGENVSDSDLTDFSNYITEALADWICQAVDDVPPALDETPPHLSDLVSN